MLTRNLTKIDDFQTITEWLNLNIHKSTCIKAICNQTDQVPTKKGIYFWFMKSEAYEFISLKEKLRPCDKVYALKDEQGLEWHLVYIGTAGTGKAGNSNLQERLKWHLCSKHTESEVCTGYLSTLRAGISSLLADDLIIPNVEQQLNDLFEKYFKVCYIIYEDSEKTLINSDESILIKTIRPIFNIKSNPNAKANALENPTKIYKLRRAHIINNTRNRLNCREENEGDRKKKNPNKVTSKYEHQIIDENNEGCIEYYVSRDQHIGKVTRGIEVLPKGKCKITIFNSKDPNTEFNQWRRETGNNDNPEKQNIYRYFDVTDTTDKRKPQRARYQVIKDWMEERNIDEITVRVCPVA